MRFLIVLCLVLFPFSASAFCGFYVAKADTKLFNQASKVVLTRHDGKTVITMANDYQGDAKEFAMVIPVPTFLERDQIHVTEPAIIDHLDAYTAPRLVEYFDDNPCEPLKMMAMMRDATALEESAGAGGSAASLGVKIEAEYTVGEYDIKILSAEESGGLESWLTQNGYKIPEGATDVLQSYIKQDVRFFVAKVNLEEHSKLGYSYLRPLQVAFESPKFMLPIRLGTVNAKGPQELFIFALTREGRVETTNYRTVKMPSDMDVPLFVKDEFSDFYRSMFDQQVKKEDMRAVFLEYAWNMAWCDPCAADPLSNDELRELGVFWQEEEAPLGDRPRTMIAPNPTAAEVYVTRLHLRYDAERFPEDLRFQETGDNSNFQGRYVLHHPWKGARSQCKEAAYYLDNLPRRFDREAKNLAHLTGWDVNNIRDKMAEKGQNFTPIPEEKWYKKLWK